jgi:hypothetical protein
MNIVKSFRKLLMKIKQYMDFTSKGITGNNCMIRKVDARGFLEVSKFKTS